MKKIRLGSELKYMDGVRQGGGRAVSSTRESMCVRVEGHRRHVLILRASWLSFSSGRHAKTMIPMG